MHWLACADSSRREGCWWLPSPSRTRCGISCSAAISDGGVNPSPGSAGPHCAPARSGAAAAALRGIPLWIVTRGAQQGAAGSDSGLAGAALWGFGRVLVNEIPRLSLCLLDVPAALGGTELAERLLGELIAAAPDTEIVW